jgi:hypothetical protein
MPLDAMADGGPDYSATPSDLRIQKRNNNGASIRDPSIPIERERSRGGVQRRAAGRLGLAAKRRAEKRGGDESSPHSLPESPGEWQWRLAGRARVASGDGGWRSARGDRSPLFQSQLGSSSAEWCWVFFFFLIG